MHGDISNFGSILLQLSDLLLGKKIWEYIFLTEQDPYTYTEVIFVKKKKKKKRWGVGQDKLGTVKVEQV